MRGRRRTGDPWNSGENPKTPENCPKPDHLPPGRQTFSFPATVTQRMSDFRVRRFHPPLHRRATAGEVPMAGNPWLDWGGMNCQWRSNDGGQPSSRQRGSGCLRCVNMSILDLIKNTRGLRKLWGYGTMSNSSAIRRHHTHVVHLEEPPMDGAVALEHGPFFRPTTGVSSLLILARPMPS